MPITAQDLKEAVTAHRRVLFVQRAGRWFPDGPWSELSGVERELSLLQLAPSADNCHLTRILPYDLPRDADCTDPGRFQDWLNVASITSALPVGMSIQVYHSTDIDQDKQDALLVDDAADAHLEVLRPSLIHPSDDWRDSASGPDHNAYWEGAPG